MLYPSEPKAYTEIGGLWLAYLPALTGRRGKLQTTVTVAQVVTRAMDDCCQYHTLAADKPLSEIKQHPKGYQSSSTVPI